MVAIGLSNVATGLFQGFAVGASASRTTVAERSRAKTQLAGLVGAVVIIVMIVAVPWLLRDLPQATLAALLIAGAISLADLAGIRRLWHLHRAEFAISIAAFLGVALLGVLRGVAVAVGLAILNVFRRSWWPYSTSLGRLTGVPGFHDTRLHPEAQETEGVVLFRFDAPLFFANTRAFREDVLELAHSELKPRWIVVAAEPMTDVDTTAVEMLVELDQELAAMGISLLFAEMKREVRDKVERYGLTRSITPGRFFPTRKSALAAVRRQHEAEEHGGATT
jgi:MFS superfamily sulfate permease-like transporter